MSSSSQDVVSSMEAAATIAFDANQAAGQMGSSAASVAQATDQLDALVAPFKVEGVETSSMVEEFKQAHLWWSDRARRIAEGRDEVANGEILTHRSCALGTWYAGVGREQHGSLREYAGLEAPHERFHATLRTLILAANAGRLDEARRLVAELTQQSHDVVATLDILERAIDGLARLDRRGSGSSSSAACDEARVTYRRRTDDWGASKRA